MRSRPCKTPARDRMRDRRERHLYECECRRRRIARVDPRPQAWAPNWVRIVYGYEDCSRHRCGRALRLWWRMKRFTGAYA